MRWEAVGLRERGESRRSRKFYPATDLSISTKPRMMHGNGRRTVGPGPSACNSGWASLRRWLEKHSLLNRVGGSARQQIEQMQIPMARPPGPTPMGREDPGMLPVLPTNGVDSTARTPASSTTAKAGVPKKIGLSATSSTMICARALKAVPHTACPSWTQSKNSRKGLLNPRWASIRKAAEAGSKSWILAMSACPASAGNGEGVLSLR